MPSYMSFSGTNISGTAPKKLEDTYILVNLKDELDLSPRTTTVYVYSKQISQWNDTVIFFVTITLFFLLFIIGTILLIVFKNWLILEPRPKT